MRFAEMQNARRVEKELKAHAGRPESPASDIFGECHDTAESGGVASAAYVVVVAFARSRRAYLTLAAAEAAVVRARAQGRPASLQLMRCSPVGGGSL